MFLEEKLLLSLSRSPDAPDLVSADSPHSISEALSTLQRVYPNFERIVSNKRILDFGCDQGLQSIALAKLLNCQVLGVDINPKTLLKARGNAREYQVSADHLSFTNQLTPQMDGQFDVVISQNSFEHFHDPCHVLEQMRELSKPKGLVLLTFGPPWYSPYGSHMHFFCKLPWLNLLFSEKAVMNVRSHFRDDGAKHYEEVESGLNKMSIRKFESIIRENQMHIHFKRYDCVKGVDTLGKIPLLRELFINHVTVILGHHQIN
ncbi:class I SAM-dependent methyltransferase [Aliagarivorans taiwanensis]|uniref:class I SAM-dependent methyltransferase n=1 Tax=Aliagarivorans taiwanensis TaxID=561966 RepID=UPI00042866B4|nr:class I SAM-dependent methyltransferase [Aliagarivorans taiwanensis]